MTTFILFIGLITSFIILYVTVVPRKPIKFKKNKCSKENKICPKQYILENDRLKVEDQMLCCKFKKQLVALNKLEEIMKNENNG